VRVQAFELVIIVFSMPDATITGLFIYPVKSFGGIALSSSEVESRGLKYDRRWMLVDEEGVFMTQRSDTRLALFRTGIEADGLRLRNPSGEEFILPLEPEGGCRTVQVWKDTCRAIQVADAVDAWLSDSLDKRCSLVYMPDDSIRQTNLDFTRPGDKVSFADGFPVLVIGESSLEDLNSRLEQPLPLNRFRGNIIVRGWEPFAEDRWPKISIGDLTLRAAKQCGRCGVTTTNQDTGEVGVEPLKTLADYRKFGNGVMFGTHFVPELEGVVSVGDVVVPTEATD